MARIAAKLAELEVAQAAEQLRAESEGASSSGARRKRRPPAPPAGTEDAPLVLRTVRANPTRSRESLESAASEEHLAGLDPELLGEEPPPPKRRITIKPELRVSAAKLAVGDQVEVEFDAGLGVFAGQVVEEVGPSSWDVHFQQDDSTETIVAGEHM